MSKFSAPTWQEMQADAIDLPVRDGPYSIGSDHWPGLAKLAEECGEVIQVIGKMIAANGAADHWDGTDLHARFIDELADAQAAIAFVVDANRLDRDQLINRTADKLAMFRWWHHERRDGSLNRGDDLTVRPVDDDGPIRSDES